MDQYFPHHTDQPLQLKHPWILCYSYNSLNNRAIKLTPAFGVYALIKKKTPTHQHNKTHRRNSWLQQGFPALAGWLEHILNHSSWRHRLICDESMLSYNFQFTTYTPANTHCEPACTVIMFLLTQLLSMLVNMLECQQFTCLYRSGAKSDIILRNRRDSMYCNVSATLTSVKRANQTT